MYGSGKQPEQQGELVMRLGCDPEGKCGPVDLKNEVHSQGPQGFESIKTGVWSVIRGPVDLISFPYTYRENYLSIYTYI